MKTPLIVTVVFLSVVGVGWVKNLIKLTECDFESPYRCEVTYVAGLIPIIGMVTGWLDIGKEHEENK